MLQAIPEGHKRLPEAILLISRPEIHRGRKPILLQDPIITVIPRVLIRQALTAVAIMAADITVAETVVVEGHHPEEDDKIN
jgi:hypothetical protein